MLFSRLRWSFSLILELNLPPQNTEHPSRERQNTHGGLQRSQKSFHTAHRLTRSASHPPHPPPLSCACICDVHVCWYMIYVICVASCNVSIIFPVSVCASQHHVKYCFACEQSVGGCGWDRYSHNFNHIVPFIGACTAFGQRRYGCWFYFRKSLLMIPAWRGLK